MEKIRESIFSQKLDCAHRHINVPVIAMKTHTIATNNNQQQQQNTRAFILICANWLGQITNLRYSIENMIVWFLLSKRTLLGNIFLVRTINFVFTYLLCIYTLFPPPLYVSRFHELFFDSRVWLPSYVFVQTKVLGNKYQGAQHVF